MRELRTGFRELRSVAHSPHANGLALLLAMTLLVEVVYGQSQRALPDVKPVDLALANRLGPGASKENSGIVRSRRWPDVFWTQNDSGDEPRIYPIHRDGSIYKSERYPEVPGVLVGDAINVDWEDIAVDAEGHVIVGDFGNNPNTRRDLVLYYVDEPSATEGRTAAKKKVFFRYPDQVEFPPPRERFDFDAEALFTIGNTVYNLSKNRSDSFSKIYRLDTARPHVTNTLTYLGRLNLRGQATGADATPNGKRLAVVTYDSVWLFERQERAQSLFAGKISWLPYRLENSEVEAVCFADASGSGSLRLEEMGTLIFADRH